MVREKNKPTFIDLFAGCGGLSLGLTNSGWRGLFAVERSPDAFETFKANFLNTGSVRRKFDWPDEWLPREAMDISKLIENHRSELVNLENSVDLIAGGPPCQGFSYAGRRIKNDPRNALVDKYLELVKIVKPRFVLIENVNGIGVGHGRSRNSSKRSLTCGESVADKIVHTLEEELGYAVTLTKLNAVQFGVPQKRERYFFIGTRNDHIILKDSQEIVGLIERERKNFLKKKRLTDKMTVGDAISDFENCDRVADPDFPSYECIFYKPPKRLTAYQKVMRGRPSGTQPCSLRLARHKDKTISRFQDIRDLCEPGKTLQQEHKDKLGIKKISIRVLSRQLPSGTITTLPDDQLHFSENRILTVREQARLQGFPDSFEFRGKYTTGGEQRRSECPRYSQVGNAVPPFVAEVIGRALKDLA